MGDAGKAVNNVGAALEKGYKDTVKAGEKAYKDTVKQGERSYKDAVHAGEKAVNWVDENVVDPVAEAASNTWETVKDAASDTWATIEKAAGDVVSTIGGTIVDSVAILRDVWQSVVDVAADVFGYIGDRIGGGMGDMFRSVINDWVGGTTGNFVSTGFNALGHGLQGLGEGIREGNWGAGFEGFVNQVFKSFNSDLNQQWKGIEKAWGSFTGFLDKNLWEPTINKAGRWLGVHAGINDLKKGLSQMYGQVIAGVMHGLEQLGVDPNTGMWIGTFIAGGLGGGFIFDVFGMGAMSGATNYAADWWITHHPVEDTVPDVPEIIEPVIWKSDCSFDVPFDAWPYFPGSTQWADAMPGGEDFNATGLKKPWLAMTNDDSTRMTAWNLENMYSDTNRPHGFYWAGAEKFGVGVSL